MLYIDLSQAFDTFDHGILLNKMKHSGMFPDTLFFTISVNYLNTMLTNCKAVIYAYDTTLLYVHHNVYHILEALEQELLTLMQQFHASKLWLNLMETQYMVFNLRGTVIPKNPKPLVQNIEIQKVNSFKGLGVIFDEKLIQTKCIIYVCNKLISSKLPLNNVKNILTSETKCMPYLAHFYLHIIYIIYVWGMTLLASNRSRKLKLQKKCVRIIKN